MLLWLTKHAPDASTNAGDPGSGPEQNTPSRQHPSALVHAQALQIAGVPVTSPFYFRKDDALATEWIWMCPML